MIGLLQGMKGDHAAAVGAFKQALATEHATGEAAKALLFELAGAQEAHGALGKALFNFQKVAKLDPKYRDVHQMVQRLAGTTSPEDDSLESGSVPVKARKVGYV